MVREGMLGYLVREVSEGGVSGKRMTDVIASLIFLFLLAVPGLLLCALICLDSPGACPIFRQQRVGREGRLFTLYKFRTMVPRAEDALEGLLRQNEMDGPVFKLRADPRITRLGKYLRQTGLDELPQLWNVLRGDMSLVGPRPALPREVAQYDAYARERLAILPGITCYWQIHPNRNDLSFQQWMELDHKYLEEMCLTTDLKILAATIPTLFRRDGR